MTELTIVGRVQPASNATFVGVLGDTQVVYKPVAGEKPLWDFPDGTLADREYAAWLVDQAMGGRLVPTTWLDEGPHGLGMMQLWTEPLADEVAVDVVGLDEVPEGWHTIFEGTDSASRPVVLVHDNSADLRAMALFDAVINNSDRKGGHVLCLPDQRRMGVDHGVAFHEVPKLRTVLWGWLSEPLSDAEVTQLSELSATLEASLADALAPHLTDVEISALCDRVQSLLETKVMPTPSAEWPAIPWPAF